MTKTEKEFLKSIRLMICHTGLEQYPAPWKQVPRRYQKDFKSWVQEYKQQDWTGMWEKGWYNYGHAYVAFLIDQKLEGA